MKISVEISKYPLTADYIPPIQAFIDGLNTYPSIKVITNTMSTQVFGTYDDVMHAIQTEMKASFANGLKQVMVMKFINGDLTP